MDGFEIKLLSAPSRLPFQLLTSI